MWNKVTTLFLQFITDPSRGGVLNRKADSRIFPLRLYFLHRSYLVLLFDSCPSLVIHPSTIPLPPFLMVITTQINLNLVERRVRGESGGQRGEVQ
jgi:hypothetical protein